jgi:hypothetical protein
MAAVKATKPTKAPSNKLKAAQKKQTNKWLLLGGVAAVVVVGVVVVRLSGASSYPTKADGNVSFGTSFTTASVRSTDGWLCVATRFDGGSKGLKPSYKWTVQEKRGGNFESIISSAKMSANGNRDHACYDGKVYKENIYRVKFEVTNATTYSPRGSYYVSGFKRN